MHTIDELRAEFYLYILKRFAITMGAFDSRCLPWDYFRNHIDWFKKLRDS